MGQRPSSLHSGQVPPECRDRLAIPGIISPPLVLITRVLSVSCRSQVKSSQVVGLRDRVAIIRALLHAISSPLLTFFYSIVFYLPVLGTL